MTAAAHPPLRVSVADVRAAEARAHAADEVADCAGLLLADAVLDGGADIELLRRNYRTAKADATWCWAVYADALAQLAAVPA